MKERYSLLRYENLRWLARTSIVHLVTILLLFLSFVSLSFPYTDFVRPVFILIPIYYWCLFRPSMMPILFVFLLGLIIDLINSYPVGLHAFLFITIHLVLSTQRLFLLGQPYLMQWLGFAITSISFFLSQWLFFAVIYTDFGSIADLIANIVITALFYPIIALLLANLRKLLPPTL
ncbi:MAG: rod shape-determining protein MreD [Pseudomonadota bacterium]